MSTGFSWATVLCTGMFLASCDVVTFLGDGPLPQNRAQQSTGPDIGGSFSGAVQARYQGGYGQFFQSSTLTNLIGEAATNNPDFLILRQRVDREYLRIADTRLSNGASLSTTLSNTENRGAAASSSYSLRVDLAPGLDIWGKTAADIRSGELGSKATLFDLVASERALQKSIVGAWADLIAARTTLDLRQTRLNAYGDILAATRSEVISGAREPIDLQLAEIDTIGARDQLESQRSITQSAETALNRLLGRPVGGHLRLKLGVLPRFPGAPPARLPSDLLTRRPDVQAAWSRLLATDENFKSARLAMLPRFSLTGSSGNTTADFANLLDANLFVTSLIASLTGTLLDNGKSERQVKLAMAAVEIELQIYASTVMDAMVEVHSLLAKEHSLKRQIALQKQSVSLAKDAFNQELTDMRAGGTSLYEVSTAALRLYNSEDSIISLRNQILKNRLDLYIALGDEYFDGVVN